MEDRMQHQKGLDPEADTYFLGRSVVEEFNEQTVLHENLSTLDHVTEHEAQGIPKPSDVAGVSEDLNVNLSEFLSARIQNGANDSPYSEHLCEAEAVTDRPHRRNRTTIALAVFGISAILAAVVVLGVCFSGDCGSSDSSAKQLPLMQGPTIPPTFRPTSSSPTSTPVDVMAERVVSAFLNNITFLDHEISVNGTSAESRALTWLIQKDTVFNTSSLLALNSQTDDDVSSRVRQRYVLATLWFQQEDVEGNFVKTWTNTSGWLQAQSECEWFGIVCNVNGSVTEIVFYDYDGVDESNATNGFVGSIPPDIGLLTSLQWFSMRSNDITGTIPESIGQCNKMYIFDISGGSVFGTLPSSLGQWTDIYLFDVSENEIVGSVPESTSSWINIKGFSVFTNQLSGSIPSFVSRWSHLQFFSVYDNKLTNTIPEDIGNLVNATNFALSMNLLTGTLPPSIGRMTTLLSFYANDNLLTGTIPSSIGNWSQIEMAYFGTNQFTGNMPPGICANIQDGDIFQSDCEVNCSCCTKECLS
jgi:hypothetical protein